MLDDKIELIAQAIISELKDQKEKGSGSGGEPVQKSVKSQTPEQKNAGLMKIGLFCTGDHRKKQI